MRDAREGCDFNQGGFGSDIFMILLCDDFYSGLQISPCVAVLALGELRVAVLTRGEAESKYSYPRTYN
jgi:hypothetical protein